MCMSRNNGLLDRRSRDVSVSTNLNRARVDMNTMAWRLRGSSCDRSPRRQVSIMNLVRSQHIEARSVLLELWEYNISSLASLS